MSPFCDAVPEFHCQCPEFPLVDGPTCDPYSPAYTDAVFQALDLDGPEYCAVDADIMKGFKELICQYPTAFLLPGNPLKAVKGFEHRIDTADAPPIYRHPYKKSPEELRAIKTEIERMLKLKIIQLSQSEWGSPCILVRKPPEKGNLQPPVDYRRLNSVTQGVGNLSHLSQVFWMLSAKEKYLQNVTWSVDTGKFPSDSQIDTKLHSVHTSDCMNFSGFPSD